MELWHFGKSYSQTETNTNKPKEVRLLPSPPCGNVHDLYLKPSEGVAGWAEGQGLVPCVRDGAQSCRVHDAQGLGLPYPIPWPPCPVLCYTGMGSWQLWCGTSS